MSLVLLKRFSSSVVLSAFVRNRNSGKASEMKMKVFLQKRNPLTGSTEWDMEDEDYDYHQEIARSAFADMLHDTERNKKYYRALQLAIEKMHRDGKKANVLDIGTGTGLLSMMAVKCGADTITACEAFKPMAECCMKILQRNNAADKIKVIPKRSTDITVGEDGDMKEKANILVTEVFDTELIGEGALSTFSHAHKFLLEKDCIVVPDSAVIYAQVVECPILQKWNKIDDISDPQLNYVLKSPQKMKDCAGTAAVHDIQLSQLPRSAFTELSEQIPVFYYDWSGKTPIAMNRMVKQEFTTVNDGRAQAVFMWWELNMDTEGKVVLSCAPWWNHPQADLCSEHPEDSIPWRDHWMQGVYYLPQDVPVKKDTEVTLISCQDEYSLWFYIENEIKQKYYKRPICECGVHMAWSRTHVSHINDEKHRDFFLKRLKTDITKDSVVLDLNGSSLMGLLAAKMSKKVYIHEQSQLNMKILDDFIKENDIDNVTFVPEVNEGILKEVTKVICDPSFSSSILPWENLKVAYLVHKYKEHLSAEVIPEAFELWAMPVEFQNLHKIRVPLGKCEGFDMSIFDQLVESSRVVSDEEIEAQPLWEYPCKSSGDQQLLIRIEFNDLKAKYAVDGTFQLSKSVSDEVLPVNGFALWSVWTIGDIRHSTGPEPKLGERGRWDMHSRQAVKILKNTQLMNTSREWSYQLTCDLERGQFNVNVDLVKDELLN